MHSPVQALLWEQWRQVRWVALGCIALTWCIFKTAQMAFPNTDPADWGDVSNPLVVLALVLVMSGLLFTHSSVSEIRMSIPARLLTLPVSGLTLALAQIGFRFAVLIGVGGLLWLILTGVEPGVIAIALLVFAYASALGATVGRRSSGAAFIILLTTLVPVFWALSATNEILPVRFRANQFPAIAFAVVCVAISVAGLLFARRSLNIRVERPAFARSTTSSIRFGKISSEIWLEWRRTAYLYPVFTIALFTLIGAASILDRGQTWGTVLLQTMVVGPPAVGFAVGLLLMAREHRDNATGMARFLWTRAQTVEQVVLSRIAVIAISAFATYLPLALACAASLIVIEPPALGAILFAYSIAFVLLMSASILFACAPQVPLAYILFAIAFSAIAENLVSDAIAGMLAYVILFWIPALAFFLWLLSLLRIAQARKLFRRRTVEYCIVACVVLWLLLALGATNGVDSATSAAQIFAGVFVLGLTPLFALMWQGVFLDRIRHGVLLKPLPPRDEAVLHSAL